MAITPTTNLFLLKCPLGLDNKNQLTFANKKEQFDYFSSLEYLEIENISYQRKDSVIRFPEHIDNIIEYNYCMYQNKNYGNKWFYAFITGMQYVTDSNTYISITTDVFQTWQFDLQFKESFIEREMIDTNKDLPGANLIPEGLETGEFKIDGTAGFSELEPVYIIAFTGDNYNGKPLKQTGFEYNGIWSSITFIVTNALQTSLTLINNAGDGDKIFTVFSIPKLAVWDFIPHDTEDLHVYYDLPLEQYYKQSPIIKTLLSRPNTLDGYTPRNKKLLTYPYLYLGFNPQNGSKKIYRYEDFTNGTPSFKLLSEINPNPTVQFIPQNYRGKNGDNLSDNSAMNGYPNISYKNDYYNTWLAQNSDIISLNMAQEQYNYEISAVKGGINLASNLASGALGAVSQSTDKKGNISNNVNSGGIIGTLTSSAMSGLEMASLDKNHEFYIQQQMAQIEKQKLLPDTVSMSSSNATLLGYDLMDDNIFTRYSIKKQFAERIDKFFDMYGYITNTVKKPNINNRPNWNYVKTIGANIEGYIPQEDLQIIKNIFDNGVTLWHKTSTFLDYSQNNRKE